MSDELKPPQFPVALRKMWSGAEVQAWIDEHWNTRSAQQAAEPASEPQEAVGEECKDE